MTPQAAARARTFLHQTQNPDGGWPLMPGTTSATEATALALLALHPAGDETTRAVAWLLAAQHPDGGWGLNAADSLSQWHTAWAALALAVTVGPQAPACRQTRTWLLKNAGLAIAEAAAIAEISRLLRVDPTLRGWPWGPGEASWVEPTALAVLALRELGADSEPRVTEGTHYLRDRRCASGGWNVGNPFMFDKPFEPRAYPTALALLALADPSSTDNDEAVHSGLAALRRQMQVERDALSLAWGLLALDAWNERDDEGAAALLAAQRPDGSWRGPTTVTAAALLRVAGRWPS